VIAIDVFCGHFSDTIRSRLRNKNTNLVIIPSGMRSQLQLLDVSINIPFRLLVCKQYDAWVNKDHHILALSDKIERTSASIIVEWISNAWKGVLVNIIAKSCCLFTAEDGMQDDILWDNSEQKW
jgi:hypothetical protein